MKSSWKIIRKGRRKTWWIDDMLTKSKDVRENLRAAENKQTWRKAGN